VSLVAMALSIRIPSGPGSMGFVKLVEADEVDSVVMAGANFSILKVGAMFGDVGSGFGYSVKLFKSGDDGVWALANRIYVGFPVLQTPLISLRLKHGEASTYRSRIINWSR